MQAAVPHSDVAHDRKVLTDIAKHKHMTLPSGPHTRQHGLDDIDRPEEFRLELISYQCLRVWRHRQFLYGPYDRFNPASQLSSPTQAQTAKVKAEALQTQTQIRMKTHSITYTPATETRTPKPPRNPIYERRTHHPPTHQPVQYPKPLPPPSLLRLRAQHLQLVGPFRVLLPQGDCVIAREHDIAVRKQIARESAANGRGSGGDEPYAVGEVGCGRGRG
ncbi:hypothetical protein G7Y79_00007g022310 [Physcia stellaris]|nr:hypothetical protein G7Y79_00007g022310 [Physcia stellaris]